MENSSSAPQPGRPTVTYLVGSLLAVNAVEDAYLWVDAPDCFFFKADFIQGNHDLLSTLRRENGLHKFYQSVADADNVVMDRRPAFEKSLSKMLAAPAVKALFATSMPMAQIIGTDYEGVANPLRERYGKPLHVVASRSMSETWLEGYADVLAAVAKDMPAAAPGGRDPKKVAVVGNLFDRHEGDCRANVAEIRRILTAFGFETVSVWLDGGNYADLLKADEAGTVLSLPYGRKAARTLARRTGAALVEADLPFGFSGTERFVAKVAEAAGRSADVPAFLESEAVRAGMGVLRWAVPRRFHGRAACLYADPYLLPGLTELARHLGLRVAGLYLHGKAQRFGDLAHPFPEAASGIPEGAPHEFAPCDVLVGTSHHQFRDPRTARVDFGFPSFGYHTFSEVPYFGFSGALALAGRVHDALPGCPAGFQT